MGIWANTPLPIPEYELDWTDPANVHATGRKRLRPGDICTDQEYSDAMDDINASLTGNHRRKAKYLK